MFIRAYCVLGIKTVDGRSPVYPGSVAEVNDEDGLRMIEDGCAVEVGAGASVRSGKAAPVSGPGENPSKDGTAQNSPENAGNGQAAGHLDAEQLQEMTFTELKALAKDMGIETGKIKSKAGMIEAITAVEVYADELEEAPPVFDAQDVIEE